MQGKMNVVGVKLPDSMIGELDKLTEKALKEHPGMKLTRSDVIRSLLLKAMEQEKRGAR